MANSLGGMVISIGFNVDNKKLSQLENRLKKIGALWDGITAKKLQGMETAATRASARIIKIEEGQSKKQLALAKARSVWLRRWADLEEKNKADAAKRETDRQDMLASQQRRHAMEQKRAFNDLKSGLMGIAAVSATASAGIWAVLNRAGQSGASMRNFLLQTGLSRDRTKDLAYSGAKFGISEEQMFGNILAIQSNLARVQKQGGGTAPFAVYGLDPNQNPLDFIEQLRERVGRLKPDIARSFAEDLGINKDMFAFLQSGERGKMPEAFKLSGTELNNLIRLNMAMNEFLYLLGEFANKVAGKVGDKLAKIIEGMSDFLGVALDAIEALDQMPVVGKILKTQALLIIGGITGIAIASAMAVIPLAALANAIKVVGASAALSTGTTALGEARSGPLGRLIGGGGLLKGLGIAGIALSAQEGVSLGDKVSNSFIPGILEKFGIPATSIAGREAKYKFSPSGLLETGGPGAVIHGIKEMMAYSSLSSVGNGGSTDNSRNVGQVTLNVYNPEDVGQAMDSLMESLGGVPYTMPMQSQ